MDVLTSKVDRTTYEAGNGNTLLVSFLTVYGEWVKVWYRLNSSEFKDFWDQRTRLPTPSCVEEALVACKTGKLLPTAEVSFHREKRWPTVTSTKAGMFDPKLRDFMSEVENILGDVTVIEVRA